MITAGFLSALQHHATSGSLFKPVKHARSLTATTLLFSDFSGEKSFLHFIILLKFKFSDETSPDKGRNVAI